MIKQEIINQDLDNKKENEEKNVIIGEITNNENKEPKEIIDKQKENRLSINQFINVEQSETTKKIAKKPIKNKNIVDKSI